ncbi:UDP-N-acetylmuramate--L-alanine ligase [Ravibacter arvi]|uniref:UDP-N-acetylmuramate--L-alanine ligase n=1 Tax=Ravibacter arvi TaxID=2051041 RepID=A0ABP8LSJ4_9BACT
MELGQGYQNVFFVGIGGIGMSAIARWFHVNGYQVAGYDRTPTPLTAALQEEGIRIIFEDSRSAIPAGFSETSGTLVVFTPAIPKDSEILSYFRDSGFDLRKRSQILGLLAAEMTTIAIAGTHGKTTTSSMTAHIVRSSGINCAAFLGGITNNYQSNFLLNQPAANMKDVVCVVEADEFDRSFLTLFPHVAVVTSTDADHLDIYGNHNELLSSFQNFVDQVDRDGKFFLRKGLSLRGPANTYAYGLDEGDYHAGNIRVEAARFVFDIHTPSGIVRDIRLQAPGFHNVENAVAACAAALAVGVTHEQVRDGLNSFKGVKRRFEFVLEGPHVQIDDYAHHPAEIAAFLKSVKALYPGKPVTAVFQPHLFTRTRDFADGFAESLALADQIYLLDIYPARELPIEGVDAGMLLAKIPKQSKQLVGREELLELVKKSPPEILVTIGAGDIDKLVSPIKSILQPSNIP